MHDANPKQMRFGFMDALTQSLSVHDEVDETWVPYLFFHEMLHALSFMGHLQFLRLADNRFKDDETKVDELASLLSHVLVSNHLLNEEALSQLFVDNDKC